MPANIYRVKLTNQERQAFKDIISKGRAAARKQSHTRILLLSDENSAEGFKKDHEVMASVDEVLNVYGNAS